jgi:ABC-type amino acid transport substrate-binding protein
MRKRRRKAAEQFAGSVTVEKVMDPIPFLNDRNFLAFFGRGFLSSPSPVAKVRWSLLTAPKPSNVSACTGTSRTGLNVDGRTRIVPVIPLLLAPFSGGFCMTQFFFWLMRHCLILSWIVPATLALSPDAQSQDFRVGLKEAPPFTYRNEQGKWEGISIHLWEKIAKDLNLAFHYEEDALPALFDKLKNKELDIVIGAITVTPEREKFVDYTHSIYSSGLGIASASKKKPILTSIVEGLFSYKFLKSVLLLMFILFLAGAFLWLFERKRNPDQFGGSPAQGLGNGLWWSAVTMTTVGYGDKSPTTLGGRIVAIVWMFSSIMIISGFTATIAASLTVRNLVPGIQNFGDLPGRTIGTVKTSSSDVFLKNEGFRKIRYYTDIPSALNDLKSQEVDAVVYDAPILKHYVKTIPEYSEYSIVEDNSARQQYAFALPEDSDQLESINRKLLETIFDSTWASAVEKYIPKPKKS